MKKFKFRMESVIGLREKKLNDEQLKLAEIQNILNSQLDILNEMHFQKQKIIEEINRLQNSEEMRIPEICNCKNFLERINSDIKTQMEMIRRTQIQLDEQKKKVEEAYKELKTLENLKERQKEEHYKKIEQEEIKEADDITISRYRGEKGK